jgi:hypothetical protein
MNGLCETVTYSMWTSSFRTLEGIRLFSKFTALIAYGEEWDMLCSFVAVTHVVRLLETCQGIKFDYFSMHVCIYIFIVSYVPYYRHLNSSVMLVTIILKIFMKCYLEYSQYFAGDWIFFVKWTTVLVVSFMFILRKPDFKKKKIERTTWKIII